MQTAGEFAGLFDGREPLRKKIFAMAQKARPNSVSAQARMFAEREKTQAAPKGLTIVAATVTTDVGAHQTVATTAGIRTAAVRILFSVIG